MINCIGDEVLSFDRDEFWMIRSDYEFIEFHAAKNRLLNTAAALMLARGLHDGAHRKAVIIRDQVAYHLPYVIHPLRVCRGLIELNITLSHDEADILFASALCHDMIEDVSFENGGTELYERFCLDRRVYETVRTVSKRRDFSEEEELEHFRTIARGRLTMLVKAADRANNVEDLYNRSSWKVHEYVAETRKYFSPMLRYAAEHYKDIESTVCILRDKIFSLTEAAEFLVSRYDQQEEELNTKLLALRQENEALREVWDTVWHRSVAACPKPEAAVGRQQDSTESAIPREGAAGISGSAEENLQAFGTYAGHIDELYGFIDNYIKRKGLKGARIALGAVMELMRGVVRTSGDFDREGVLQQSFLEHALSVTKLLIDLRIGLSEEEEDILVSAALCHDTIAHADFARHGSELTEDYGLDPRVYEIIRITTKIDIYTETDLRAFYDGIKRDKLAVLIAMADRGSLAENVYALSISEALEYISEIRRCALPMCVYALANYPDIHFPLRTLISKVHSLIDVTDIISRRYQDKELACKKEILQLMEENAQLIGMIRASEPS